MDILNVIILIVAACSISKLQLPSEIKKVLMFIVSFSLGASVEIGIVWLDSTWVMFGNSSLIANWPGEVVEGLTYTITQFNHPVVRNIAVQVWEGRQLLYDEATRTIYADLGSEFQGLDRPEVYINGYRTQFNEEFGLFWYTYGEGESWADPNPDFIIDILDRIEDPDHNGFIKI